MTGWADVFGMDPGWSCAHEWLLRPEHDDHVCQICGNEMTTPAPTGAGETETLEAGDE